MSSNIIMGIGALGFGLTTLVARFVAPDSTMFSKLEPMKQRLGPRAGLALHWTAYTLVPLVVGASMLVKAMSGE